MPEKDEVLAEILTVVSILLVQEGIFYAATVIFCSLGANQAGQINFLTLDGYSFFSLELTRADMLDRQSKITNSMLSQHDISGGG